MPSTGHPRSNDRGELDRNIDKNSASEKSNHLLKLHFMIFFWWYYLLNNSHIIWQFWYQYVFYQKFLSTLKHLQKSCKFFSQDRKTELSGMITELCSSSSRGLCLSMDESSVSQPWAKWSCMDLQTIARPTRGIGGRGHRMKICLKGAILGAMWKSSELIHFFLPQKNALIFGS